MSATNWAELILTILLPGAVMIYYLFATTSQYENGKDWHYSAFWAMFFLLALGFNSV